MTDKPTTDQLYADPRDVIADFVFDDKVAEVFPDMINRSVPGYGTIISMLSLLAAHCVTPGSRCYDLGCSLGAASLAIARGVGRTPCRIVAVDNSSAMLDRARGILASLDASPPIDLVCADARDVAIEAASMVVLNFTLQFVPLELRRQLLQAIHRGMNPGGMLVLSEKIALPDADAQGIFTELHHGFKMAQGYSELEIGQKRAALEKVLLPETLEQHVQRLRAVGFGTVEVWFQCFNFVSILALK
ncbi:MAG: carboxy-S-adenosyl-L-methionine synthase CmoA [Candidatus Thiodiazotropha sp.]